MTWFQLAWVWATNCLLALEATQVDVPDDLWRNTLAISDCDSRAAHRRMVEKISGTMAGQSLNGPMGGEVGRTGTGDPHTPRSSQTQSSHSPAQEILAQTVLVVHRRKIDHRRHAGCDRAFLHVPGLGGRHNTPSIRRRALILASARRRTAQARRGFLCPVGGISACLRDLRPSLLPDVQAEIRVTPAGTILS